ncbi:tRNA pseudouridine(55) synthase TruB [Pleionea sediminis]|uniref:tRNA pseudouridine(55) synthase TruB n=1 Tax=Pleionea sediminis TaxID=2569479 RepID=UPI001184C4C6|nr:tRNA pseudouridine(55) synthase TruB [Pleionea sediminis]
MARKRKGRSLDGILLLDKPTGESSNRVLQQVRRLYNAAKAGHTGSLDPLASGMLPICFGEATKFSQYLLNSDKSYRVTGKLGETTTTADAEGEVRERREVNVSESQLLDVVKSFLGESMQVPSMFSALKHNGQPLYKLARQGIEVERKARAIHIYRIELESYNGNEFSLFVECSKGTYIRNLVEDIGEILGCGAHVIALRREWVAHFKTDNMISIADIQSLRDDDKFAEMDELLLPSDEALSGYPSVELDHDSAFYFLQGQSVTVTDSELEHHPVIRVYDEHHRFLGVAAIDDELQLAPKRVIANRD